MIKISNDPVTKLERVAIPQTIVISQDFVIIGFGVALSIGGLPLLDNEAYPVQPGRVELNKEKSKEFLIKYKKSEEVLPSELLIETFSELTI